MFCKACGSEIVETAVICPKCGTATGTASVTETPEKAKQLITWGYVGAVLMPIVGIILGIVNMVKGRIGHGVGQITVSVFFWMFWIGFFGALAARG